MHYYIRHGATYRNAGQSGNPDDGLTLEGATQASRAGRELLTTADLIGYTGLVSPMRRTRETAERIAAMTGLSFVVVPDLRDWQETVNVAGVVYQHEEADAVVRRIGRLWDRIRGGRHVIVSHAAPIALMLQLENGSPPNINGYSGVENAKVYRGG